MKKKMILSVLVLACGLPLFSQVKLSGYQPNSQRLNEEYCTGLFSTQDGVYFDFLNDQSTISSMGYINVLDWLQGRVAGLQIYYTRTRTAVPFIRGSRAGVFVDEIYRDPEFLNALPVADIAMIKIIKGPFASAFNSPGGAIAIYTVRGEEDDEAEE